MFVLGHQNFSFGAGPTSDRHSPRLIRFFQLMAIKTCCRLPNAQLFSQLFIKSVWVKTIQNQHKHIIS
jgi:hypothetical protein